MTKRTARIIAIIALVIISTVILTSCFPGDGVNTDKKKAGFFTGIWHGWIAPFSLIYSIFNKNIGIYEVNNTGFWYNFGYYIAIISGFGGIAFTRRRKDRD